MKTKLLITLIAVSTLLSCKSGDKNNSLDEEHEEKGHEGVVILNEKQREALNLELGSFLMRNLTTVVKVNGLLKVPPESSADITAIIGGNVKKIKVFHGDKVKKGQQLAVLEHPDYIALQEDFAVIANNLEYLEQEYKRQKELFENNVGSGREYQQSKAAWNTGKARYEGLKSRLQILHISPEKVKEGKISKTINIISPINGYVNEIKIKVGTYIDAKDKIFEITDNSAIHADFMVYENDVHFLRKGQKVHFTVSNQPGKEYTARVFAIGREFEPNTRSVHIHARIKESTAGLIPGMYISGHLHADENLTRTLPNDALVAEGAKSYVFIKDDTVIENSHENENLMAFRMVEVITGQKDDGFTEVHLLDSLPENTRIVMNTAYYLLSDLRKEETEHEH